MVIDVNMRVKRHGTKTYAVPAWAEVQAGDGRDISAPSNPIRTRIRSSGGEPDLLAVIR